MEQIACPPPDQVPPPPSSSRGGRSSSQARFGNMSHHAFFTRHNPHPSRVRHIKGLLDSPICFVDDSDVLPSPRSVYNFPPNSYNESQVRSYRMPISAVNLGTGYTPVDTLTGLQRFTGLQNYPYKEKAVPHIGLVPITEGWRQELHYLTRNVALGRHLLGPQAPQSHRTPQSPRKTQYSATTGRIIPSSRNGTGKSKKYQFGQELDRMIEENDMETKVFEMICQLLQADDINSVKSWLMSAGDREKAIVTDLLHHALASHGDLPGQPQYVADPPRTPFVEQKENGEHTVDRLTIEDGRITRERRPPGEPLDDKEKQNGFLPPIDESQDQRPATTQRLQVFSRQSIRDNHHNGRGPKSRNGRPESKGGKSCEEPHQVWKPDTSVAVEEE